MKGKKGDLNLVVMLLIGVLIVFLPLIFIFKSVIGGLSAIMLTLMGLVVLTFGGWALLDLLS